MTKTVAVVIPVFDDWDALAVLLKEIALSLSGSGLVMRIYAVDDGSLEPCNSSVFVPPASSVIEAIEVIRLATNLGHQRAIAIGLCAVVEDGAAEIVVVMDSDGQDRPADIAALLEAGVLYPRHVIMAARARRSEAGTFRLCYRLYRLMFRALTGQTIRFGNFCLIPMPAARRLVHMPELWNNLAASVMRSRLPYMTVPTMRGKRGSGCSKMNVPALVVHGLSAMSVFSDMILVRTLLAAGGITALAALGMLAVAVTRLATRLAIPGWAMTVAGDLWTILLQTVVVTGAATLTMLAGRGSSRPIVPIVDYPAFVAEREGGRRNLARRIIGLARPVA